MDMSYEELEYGDEIPGVVCPGCGGDLVLTSSGAFCHWCTAYVPVVGIALHIDNDDDDEDDSDWIEEE